MRPVQYSSAALRQFLLRKKIATLPELKDALGTQVALTVFRKLKPLDYQLLARRAILHFARDCRV